MKLIVENDMTDLAILNETDLTTGKTQLFIEGVFAQSEKRNRNGRLYPDHILEREVESFNENLIKQNRALGELEHPEKPGINPDRVSHRITEMKKCGNDYIGKALILDTPCGNIARGIIEGGTTMGVSTRGVGTLTKTSEGAMVNENFGLVTVDIVTNPSGIDCFVKGIMEGVEWQLDESGVYKQAERQEAFVTTETMISEGEKFSKIMAFINSL